MPAPELPGMRAIEAAATAPADILSLATRQVGEAVETMNAGVARTMDALEVPGLPPLTQMLPGSMGAPISAPPAVTKRVVSTEVPVTRPRAKPSAAYGDE